MRRLQALFQLSRPINVLITMLSVWVAAVIARGMWFTSPVLLACLSAGLIAAGANTINDYFDIAIDRLNKPERPLPAGKISPELARLSALGEFLLGGALSLFISLPMFGLAIGFSLLLVWYSAYLKRTVLWGNVAVSLSTAAAFIYGGLSVAHPEEAVFPACFAFFFHFGREIIKDMQDVAGDRQHQANTFPVRFGNTPSVALVWLNFGALIGLTILPFWKSWYGATYMIIVATGIYPVIGYVLYRLLQHPPPVVLGRLSNLLKADMLVGLLAIYLR